MSEPRLEGGRRRIPRVCRLRSAFVGDRRDSNSNIGLPRKKIPSDQPVTDWLIDKRNLLGIIIVIQLLFHHDSIPSFTIFYYSHVV